MLLIISIIWIVLLCITNGSFFELVEKADQGDAEALFQVGKCYILGNGVEKDYIKARKFLEKAAKKGHAKAHFFIGLLYFNGHGVEQDLDQANRWFKMADERGFSEGKQILRVLALGYDESLYFGGDGSCIDMAVRICTQNRMLGIRAEYKFIDQIATKRGFSYTVVRQSLLEHNHQVFDRIDIFWEDNEEESFFFDITEFHT